MYEMRSEKNQAWTVKYEARTVKNELRILKL